MMLLKKSRANFVKEFFVAYIIIRKVLCLRSIFETFGVAYVFDVCHAIES